MLDKEERRRLIDSFKTPAIFVCVIWAVKIIETCFGLDFGKFGIQPLKVEGLPGIILFHFIHGGWSHLLANTLPILVLGSSLYYFYKPLANKIGLILLVSTGLLTWCGAREGVHVGASALIYGLTFFLMLSGFIRRNNKLTALSFIVIFLYGSLVWGLYPKYAIDHNISWEGHLSGFIMGIALALYYRKDGPQREEHHWDDEDDEEDDEENNGEKPYWDVPQPDKDDLTVMWNYRKR